MHDNAALSQSFSSTFAKEGSSEKPRIVVAGPFDLDDEIVRTLRPQLYDIERAGSASELRDLLTERRYDLIFLDTPFPDMDGISAIQWLSSVNDMPYLIARSETNDELDRILAIELGADDCVPLSCSLREITARVRALFRRRSNEKRLRNCTSAEQIPLSGPELIFSGWVLNKDTRQLFSHEGRAIALTNAEYTILFGLFSEPGVVKDRLSLKVDGADEMDADDARALDVFVCRLRKKIAKYDGQGLIETVRGRGYRLSPIG